MLKTFKALIWLPAVAVIAGCNPETVTSTSTTETVTEAFHLTACDEPLYVARPVDWSQKPVNIYEPTEEDGLSAAERAIYDQLMAARAEAGLAPVPLSPALTLVAGRHALDASWNILGAGEGFAPGTNAHSWSDAPYYEDHSAPRAMWHAARRLGTSYCGHAYEISASLWSNADQAVSGWLGSQAHSAVIFNRGIWANKRWQAVGVGMVAKSEQGPAMYYVIFGDEPDQAAES